MKYLQRRANDGVCLWISFVLIISSQTIHLTNTCPVLSVCAVCVVCG